MLGVTEWEGKLHSLLKGVAQVSKACTLAPMRLALSFPTPSHGKFLEWTESHSSRLESGSGLLRSADFSF